jgi:hypothetical protein
MAFLDITFDEVIDNFLYEIERLRERFPKILDVYRRTFKIERLLILKRGTISVAARLDWGGNWQLIVYGELPIFDDEGNLLDSRTLFEEFEPDKNLVKKLNKVVEELFKE